MVQTDPATACISRPDLGRRWRCHTETLKRREKQGLLHPIYLSSRMIRYRLSEVEALEKAGDVPATAQIPGRFVATTVSTPASVSTSVSRRRRGQPMKRAPRRKSGGAAGVEIDLQV